MVTLDVKSLFSTVPLHKALQVVEQRLPQDDSYEKYTQMSLSSICQLTRDRQEIPCSTIRQGPK